MIISAKILLGRLNCSLFTLQRRCISTTSSTTVHIIRCINIPISINNVYRNYYTIATQCSTRWGAVWSTQGGRHGKYQRRQFTFIQRCQQPCRVTLHGTSYRIKLWGNNSTIIRYDNNILPCIFWEIRESTNSTTIQSPTRKCSRRLRRVLHSTAR